MHLDRNHLAKGDICQPLKLQALTCQAHPSAVRQQRAGRKLRQKRPLEKRWVQQLTLKGGAVVPLKLRREDGREVGFLFLHRDGHIPVLALLFVFQQFLGAWLIRAKAVVHFSLMLFFLFFLFFPRFFFWHFSLLSRTR